MQTLPFCLSRDHTQVGAHFSVGSSRLQLLTPSPFAPREDETFQLTRELKPLKTYPSLRYVKGQGWPLHLKRTHRFFTPAMLSDRDSFYSSDIRPSEIVGLCNADSTVRDSRDDGFHLCGCVVEGITGVVRDNGTGLWPPQGILSFERDCLSPTWKLKEVQDSWWSLPVLFQPKLELFDSLLPEAPEESVVDIEVYGPATTTTT